MSNIAIEDAANKFGSKGTEFRLWAEVTPQAEGTSVTWARSNLIPGTHIVIFLKQFDLETQTLKGINHVYMKKNEKVADLWPLINDLMDWPQGTQARLYEVNFMLLLRRLLCLYL